MFVMGGDQYVGQGIDEGVDVVVFECWIEGIGQCGDVVVVVQVVEFVVLFDGLVDCQFGVGLVWQVGFFLFGGIVFVQFLE